ncbi:MAG: tetratricopeptide repeat protein [Candidatus Lokiarchaeota archaeon]|nr:tetratricopeptide repeat protein [Candidatus Lokiarchaeota archaeon]
MLRSKSILTAFTLLLLFSSSICLAENKHKINGKEYLESGELRKAIKEFEKAVLDQEDDAEALFLLGASYRQLGREQIQNATSRDSANSQYINALSGINHALRIKPNDYKWLFELAQIYDDMDLFNIILKNLKSSNFDLAVQNYKKTISVKPKFWQAYLSLGLLYCRKGKYPQAIDNFYEVLKIDPSNETAYTNIFECIKKQKDKAQAIDNLNRLKKILPDSSEPYLILSEIRKKEGDLQASLKELKKATDLEPDNEIIEKEITETIHEIKVDSIVNYNINKGDSLLDKNQFSSAIVCFKKVLEKKPGHNDALKKLKGSRSRFSDYWFDRGAWNLDYKNLNDDELKKRIGYFNKAFEYAEGKDQINKIWKTFIKFQEELGERGKIYQVIEKGQKYIKDGNYLKARNYLIVAYEDTKNPKIKIAIDTLKIADLYKKAQLKEGDGYWSAALTLYNEIQDSVTDYKDVNYRIAKVKGDLAYDRKDWKQANKFYSEALELDSSKSYINAHVNAIIRTKIKESKQKIIIREIVIIVIIVLLISIILSIYLMKILKFKRFSLNKIMIKLFEIMKIILSSLKFYLLLVLLLLIFFIDFGNLYDVLIENLKKLDVLIRGLIIFAALLLFFTIVLIFIPTFIYTTFKIYSRHISFNLVSNRKSNNIFSESQDIEELTIKNVKYMKITIQKTEIKNLNCKKLISGELIIKPPEGTLNVDAEIVKNSSDLQIKELFLPLNSEMGFQKQDNTLIIRNGIKKDFSGTSSFQNYKFNIKANDFKLKLGECEFYQDKELIYEVSKNEQCELLLAPLDGIKNIEINGIKNSTRLEIFFKRDILNSNSITIFKNRKGRFINFYDQLELIANNKKISTIRGDSKIVIHFSKEDTINIKKDEHFIFKSDKFEKFDLSLDSNGFITDFSQRIYYLKIGEPKNLEVKHNIIPNLLLWIANNQTMRVLLPVIGLVIGIIVSAVIEWYYST